MAMELDTVCDFHNVGLIFAGQCTVCLKGLNHCFKTLILIFEAIVQPPKTFFLTFSCETKIMKITHIARGFLYYLLTSDGSGT